MEIGSVLLRIRFSSRESNAVIVKGSLRLLITGNISNRSICCIAVSLCQSIYLSINKWEWHYIETSRTQYCKWTWYDCIKFVVYGYVFSESEQ